MNSVKIKRKRPKRSEIMVGGIYACTSEEFNGLLEIEAIRVNENSITGKIIKCNDSDKELAVQKSFLTVINFKRIGKMLKAPEKVEKVKKRTSKDFNNETRIPKKMEKRVLFAFFPNGEKDNFISVKQATQVLGCRHETINKCLENDRAITKGNLKGTKFMWGELA